MKMRKNKRYLAYRYVVFDMGQVSLLLAPSNKRGFIIINVKEIV